MCILQTPPLRQVIHMSAGIVLPERHAKGATGLRNAGKLYNTRPRAKVIRNKDVAQSIVNTWMFW